MNVVRNSCPGAGACGGMYTANTMASAIETMGMTLPYRYVYAISFSGYYFFHIHLFKMQHLAKLPFKLSSHPIHLGSLALTEKSFQRGTFSLNASVYM